MKCNPGTFSHTYTVLFFHTYHNYGSVEMTQFIIKDINWSDLKERACPYAFILKQKVQKTCSWVSCY